jgi:hypothetical protein
LVEALRVNTRCGLDRRATKHPVKIRAALRVGTVPRHVAGSQKGDLRYALRQRLASHPEAFPTLLYEFQTWCINITLPVPDKRKRARQTRVAGIEPASPRDETLGYAIVAPGA